MVIALGRAKIPPVPMKRGFKEGICPYLLVSPAERKFCPEAEISSKLTVLLLRSPWLVGRLWTIAS